MKVFAIFDNEFWLDPVDHHQHDIKERDWDGNYSLPPVTEVQKIELNDIPPLSHYNVYIEIWDHLTPMSWRKADGLDRVAQGHYDSSPYWERLMKDTRDGRVHWWFDYQTEKQFYWLDFPNISRKFHAVRNKLDCPAEYLHYITGTEPCAEYDRFQQETGWRVHHVNPFEKWLKHYFRFDHKKEEYVQYFQQVLDGIRHYKTRKYSALCFNRIPRQTRAWNLTRINQQGLLHKTLYSWGIDNIPVEERQTELFQHRQHDFVTKTYGEAGLKEYHQSQYWYLPEQEPVYIDVSDLTENQAENAGFDAGLHCDFKIVTETCYNQLPFLTEKTYKAILLMLPFVIVGPAGSIQALRNKGYRTLDQWIDHSYDQEPDFGKRFDMVHKEISRLYNITSESWAGLRTEMVPDLIYNVEHLRNRTDKKWTEIFYE